jgi:outer membrane protein assembly factor BamB
MLKKLIMFLIILNNLSIFAQTQEKVLWPTLADSPWPVLRGDAQGTGRSEFVGPSTNNVVWRKDIPLGVLFGPVIGYNDRLYTGTRAATFTSSNVFYSIDSNGNTLWKFNIGHGGPTNLGPTILRDSTVIFGSAAAYSIYALNYSGELLWSKSITSGFQEIFAVSKSGKLFVAEVDTLHIIHSANGETVSKHYFDSIIDHKISFSPDGSRAYFGSGPTNQPNINNYLNAIDTSGNLLWRYTFNEISYAAPLVDNNGRIYVLGAEDNAALYCFNMHGSVLWSYDIRSFDKSDGPTMDHDGNIILHLREYDPTLKDISVLHSLDYSGDLNWRYIIDSDLSVIDTDIEHPLVCDAEGKIYFGSTYGKYFYCVNKEGELMWKLDLEGYQYDSCPAIGSDGTLYIGTHLGSLDTNNERNLIAVRDKPNSVEDDVIPSEFKLEQNYPNPFNPTTKIQFQIPKDGFVSLIVYNSLGEMVTSLVEENLTTGKYSYDFDAENLPSGIYIYRLTTSDFTSSQKMLLIK